MTRDEIDIMWQKAMQEAVEEGEMYTRYHFAKLVAEAEREACAKVADYYSMHDQDTPADIAEAIRARGNT